MHRRKFLSKSLLGMGAAVLSSSILTNNSKAAATKYHIDYIRDQAPSLQIPPYRGERYMDNIPDTLDIAERAELGIHGLTAISDPAVDFETHFIGNFYRNPPVLVHDFNDWVQLAEGLQEALPLLRTITGSSLNDQVDPVWMRTLVRSIGPDGLVFIPLGGRPWGRLNASEVDPVWKPDGSTTRFKNDQSITQFTTGEVCARSLGTMTAYYVRDQNPLWKTAGDKLVLRLAQLANSKDDYAYLMGSYVPNAKMMPNAEVPADFLAEEWDGRMVQGLSQFYKVTGFEPAIDLAGKFQRFFRFHSNYYDAEGRFLPEPMFAGFLKDYGGKGMRFGGHAHAHTVGLIGMLEYAAAANDRDTLQFVKASFEWAKSQNNTFGVSSLVGWFPEFYAPTYPSCESCTNGDMLGLAVKLSEAGAGDYWDDIDRWVRNHFAEAQLTKVEWVHEMASRLPPTPVKSNETAERAAERNIGAWSGWANPNDWAIRPTGSQYGGIVGFQHCCTGNSPRGLYYVWEHMLDCTGDKLQVNLLLNRASRWADVYSHIPYEGRVEIKFKQVRGQVRVRAPEWLESGASALTCQVNRASRPLRWDGRYVEIGAVRAGDKAVLEFPIAERTVKEKIGRETYSLLMKGNTVLSIDPGGKLGPFYQGRDKYRKNRTAWKQVNRFAPSEDLVW